MRPNQRLILDTHVWLWWVNQDQTLPLALRDHISQAQKVAISAISVYELIYLISRGKISITLDLGVWLRAATVDADIEVLAVDEKVAKLAGNLPRVHGDPLDRIIIATAIVTEHGLMSLDGKFADYPGMADLLVSK